MLQPPATLVDIFFTIVSRNAPQVMLYRRGSNWRAISSRELYRQVASISGVLRTWGIRSGDRVAILSENRPEWTIADLAILLTGAVVVPIYPTQTAEQSVCLLQDSGAKAIFISTETQLRKLLPCLAETRIEHVALMDRPPAGLRMRIEPMERMAQRRNNAGFERRARAIKPDQLATLIYTSGTTGVPKGVMLTHGNLASNIGVSLEGLDLGGRQLSVSFLPLSHITARSVDLALMYRGATIAYCSALDDLPNALRQLRPTLFLGVPRVYEKICCQVQRQIGNGTKRKLYEWAIAVAERYLPELIEGRTPRSLDWKVADRLLFSKVREALGGRAQTLISGGAPLSYDLARWFALMGMRIMEGYGLTETSPVIAVNTRCAFRLGTVGMPLSNLEVRIAEDGEILVRGPSVFQGYWHMPDETRNAFEGDWFKTGDIGQLDSDGFLLITDRKKDLIKTSGGKFIAPQPIENRLKANPLIAEAAVIGDGRHFPAVVIVPAFAALEDWARQQHIAFGSRQELVAAPEVQAAYESIVEAANQQLARFEKLKKVLLLPEELSIADGTLTPTLKLRRRNLQVRYQEQIEKLYAEAAPLEFLKTG